MAEKIFLKNYKKEIKRGKSNLENKCREQNSTIGKSLCGGWYSKLDRVKIFCMYVRVFLCLTKIRILLCYNPTSIQYSIRSWSTTTIVKKKRFKTLDNFKKIEKFNLKFAK